jgi:hypothetical protein
MLRQCYETALTAKTVAAIGEVEANWICCIPLEQLNLVRKVSAYTVAGRQRAIASATLLNMLRAAD